MWDANFTVAAAAVMSPPIRDASHRAALKGALAGGLLQLVATDHAVFNSSQKAVGRHDFRAIPNGVNGLEERLHVVWQEMVVPGVCVGGGVLDWHVCCTSSHQPSKQPTNQPTRPGLITPSDFVRVTSTAAAQAFNIYPRKGRVAPGSDADIIILDPRVNHTISAATHHSRMDTNVYEGECSPARLAWLELRPPCSRCSPSSACVCVLPVCRQAYTGPGHHDHQQRAAGVA
jgi:dihydropyrimidinase